MSAGRVENVPVSAASAAAIAQSFVDARRRAAPLSDYPGQRPTDLAAAYVIQDAAIRLWGDDIAGWKIGMVQADLRDALGVDRISGPIFTRQIVHATDAETVELAVIGGGFAAVEAEFILRIGRDQDSAHRTWSATDAAEMIGAVHIGIELAGSPFAGINDYGPAVTVSDFGNNAGLVVGAEVNDWRTIDWARAAARTSIDAEHVGEGTAAMLPGGPLAALAFLLTHCAERGRPLRKGQLISSGAVTGVHQIEAGQSAELSFGDFGVLRCRAVPARGEQTPAVASAAL
ncbi:MAG: fumarylacetoacetate hydrolase family protein [Hyphomonadaceae bacterium]|nr:fumarylacetoacetate hydrolase family protein [Hyphomonadaceae bacterium]